MLCWRYSPMPRRSIRTFAGLQRACSASNRRFERLYERSYIAKPALTRYLKRFNELDRIEDPVDRFQAFRLIPAFEYDLEAVNASLTADQRQSLAQQDRAKHPRVHLDKDGLTLESLVLDVVRQVQNPWQLKAKQYWQPLIDRLRQLQLNPQFMPDPDRPLSEKLEYDGTRKRRSLTRRQFENIVSRVRRSLSRTSH
jgi:hypothetical protein